ncbi:head GIN domain-containing protein [uncultured Sphingomonas sp.]|uniref:head GIN domain-containing protein n=1 Tax=uncultured Sphingomonas sp. TaxID=158754 RepID=UPI0025F71883|nr:head GIN domain-containing protein [uncultured Sphingomonas sp.]
MPKSVTLPTLLGLIVLAMPTAACSFESEARGQDIAAQGSGNARSYATRGFTAVSSDGSDPVDIRVGGDFAVRAEGPAADLDQLRIARDGDTLRIGIKKGVHWGSRRNVRVLVTLPRLSEAGVAGSGSMRIDRVEGNNFKGGIAGSGNLTIGAMRVGQAELGVAGSGSVNASGAVDTLKIGIAGSGNVLANGLHAKRADVGIAGSGRVAVQVDGPAKVSLSGSGDADLGPNSVCTVRKAGSGKARCGRIQ